MMKRVLTNVITLIFINSCSFTVKEHQGCISGNCVNGTGSFHYHQDDDQDGGFYGGSWRDGNRHGQGIFLEPDDGAYEGEWKNDKKHGKGIYTFANGDKYQGKWESGQVYGEGIYTFADGDKYQVKFKNNEAMKRAEAETKRKAEAMKRAEAETKRKAEAMKRAEAETKRKAEAKKRAEAERRAEQEKRYNPIITDACGGDPSAPGFGLCYAIKSVTMGSSSSNSNNDSSSSAEDGTRLSIQCSIRCIDSKKSVNVTIQASSPSDARRYLTRNSKANQICKNAGYSSGYSVWNTGISCR